MYDADPLALVALVALAVAVRVRCPASVLLRATENCRLLVWLPGATDPAQVKVKTRLPPVVATPLKVQPVPDSAVGALSVTCALGNRTTTVTLSSVADTEG